MRVKDTPIGEIRPYAGNPRNNDDAVQAVAASIQEFGWQQPIVVDIDGTVIAGHTRLKAAEALGLETVPVVVAGELTPEQVQAYRLADNRTAELAEWNLPKLDLELDGLSIDMERFGFRSWELGGGDFSGTIDDLVDEELVKKAGQEREDGLFDMTFSFPAENRPEIEAMVKEQTKSYVVSLIVEAAQEWA